jgi:hypothetical protein
MYELIVIYASFFKNEIFPETCLELTASLLFAYSVPIGIFIFGFLVKDNERKNTITKYQYIFIMMLIVLWNLVFSSQFFIYSIHAMKDCTLNDVSTLERHLDFMTHPISYLIISCPLSFLFSK